MGYVPCGQSCSYFCADSFHIKPMLIKPRLFQAKGKWPLPGFNGRALSHSSSYPCYSCDKEKARGSGMQTQYIRDTSVGTPWLERFSEDDGRAPFGRTWKNSPLPSDATNRPICKSIRTACRGNTPIIIEKSQGVYCLRDLKSTNGTFVNGQRIQEIDLQDGDLVAVASFELIFSMQPRQRPALYQTQMMTEGEFAGRIGKARRRNSCRTFA